MLISHLRSGRSVVVQTVLTTGALRNTTVDDVTTDTTSAVKCLIDLVAETGASTTGGVAWHGAGVGTESTLVHSTLVGRARVVTTSNATRSSLVRLASNLGELGDVGRLLGRADAEDRRLPSVTLLSKLLVLGSFGADAARKSNVLEDRVLLSHGDVDLGLASLLLGLLFVGSSLPLVGTEVLLVDTGCILWVILGRIDGFLSILVDGVGIRVSLDESILDLLLQDLLDDRPHDLEQDRLGEGEQQLVIRLLDLDLKILNHDVNIVDDDKVGAVRLLSVAASNFEAEALATKEDVHDTLVSDGWEALLLLDVVRDILEIHLDTRTSNHDLVITLVFDLFAAKTEVVVTAHFEDVREQVVALNDKVLDHSIDHRVGCLNTRNGDVASVLKDGRDDDLCQVLDEMRLEGGLAVLILTKVIEKAIH